MVELAAYLSAIIGYLMVVLTSPRMELPGFLLLTAATVLWIALFTWLSNADLAGRRLLLVTAGLSVTALASVAAIWLHMGLDWLLPVVTVAVLTIVYPWRLALPFIIAVAGGTLLITFTAFSGPFGERLSNEISLIPAFLFAGAFTLMIRRELEQRARAEALVAQLEAAQEQLRAHADQIEELTVTRERNRMAREIHDTLGHYLTILAVQLETALKLQERDDPRLAEELAEARRMASECLAEVRRSVSALRPVDLTRSTLREALARLAGEVEAVRPGIEIVLDVEGDTQRLAPEPRVTLYRAVQESLTNVRKHAQATKVLVRLRVEHDAADLTVLDNGRGAGDGADGADGHMPGYGLTGMRERIALASGTITAGPDASGGWRVEVHLPVAPGAAGDARPVAPVRAERGEEARDGAR